MHLSNQRLDQMLEQCRRQLARTDLIGYAAARNARRLEDALVEFHVRRDALVEKYGEPETDEEGTPTGRTSLAITSPGFPKFVNELEPFLEIEHEFKPFRIPYGEAIGKLSGAELLELDWMFEEATER